MKPPKKKYKIIMNGSEGVNEFYFHLTESEYELLKSISKKSIEAADGCGYTPQMEIEKNV